MASLLFCVKRRDCSKCEIKGENKRLHSYVGTKFTAALVQSKGVRFRFFREAEFTHEHLLLGKTAKVDRAKHVTASSKKHENIRGY